MLFREVTDVYCENLAKYINKYILWKNSGLLDVKRDGI
jgi:hypothetical protein